MNVAPLSFTPEEEAEVKKVADALAVLLRVESLQRSAFSDRGLTTDG